MNTANLTFRLFGFGRMQRATPIDDPADMGTCFGLDMSIDDPLPTSTAPVDVPLSAAWWRRLSSRRRTQD